MNHLSRKHVVDSWIFPLGCQVHLEEQCFCVEDEQFSHCCPQSRSRQLGRSEPGLQRGNTCASWTLAPSPLLCSWYLPIATSCSQRCSGLKGSWGLPDTSTGFAKDHGPQNEDLKQQSGSQAEHTPECSLAHWAADDAKRLLRACQ